MHRLGRRSIPIAPLILANVLGCTNNGLDEPGASNQSRSGWVTGGAGVADGGDAADDPSKVLLAQRVEEPSHVDLDRRRHRVSLPPLRPQARARQLLSGEHPVAGIA